MHKLIGGGAKQTPHGLGSLVGSLPLLTVDADAPPPDVPALVKGKAFANSIGMKFALVPTGEGTIGSPSGEAGRRDEEYASNRDAETWTTAIEQSTAGLPVTVLLLCSDYHPFDGVTGAAVEQAAMAKRLEQRMQTLEPVARQAERGGKAQESLAKGRQWVQKLVAGIAWFWTVVRVCVEQRGLSHEVEQVIYEKLLPGLYGQKAARLGRTVEGRGHGKR